MDGKIKAEAAREAAAARHAWRRAQGRRSMRELQGRRHRAPLLWLVVPFLCGASLQRLGGECPFPHAAAIAAALAAIAIAASFGRSAMAHALWAAAHCAATTLIGLLVLHASSDMGPFQTGYQTLRLRVTHMGPPRVTAHASHRIPGHRTPAASASRRRGRARADPTPASPADNDAPSTADADPAESRSARRAALAATGFGTVASTKEAVAFTLTLGADERPPIRGEEIILGGWPKPVPSRGGADTYNGFLRGLGVRREIVSARVLSIPSPPSWYARHREALAERMTALLARNFGGHPELAAIYRAMMLGKKDGLTAAQKQLFVRSGTMHLFAINGLHIGVVALSAHALLSLLRVRGRTAAIVVLGILWLDVDSTGAAPSAVRAFLMVALLEIAHAAWLPMNPLAAITGAAAAMLALGPADAFGASFQMSFGVVAALILLGMPLADHLRQRWDPHPLLPGSARTRWQHLRGAVQQHAATAAGFSAAAALVSAITGVTYFAAWSPAGLPANLLLMPLATLVIIAGFSAIVAGLAHATVLTGLFNTAACLLLQAITWVLARIVAFPCASFTAHLRADWIGPAALVLLLAVCLRGYAAQWDREHGGWWPPFLATAAMMIFGVKYG